MINLLICKIFKPDFVGIGNVVFRRDEILSVGIARNPTQVIVTYRDMSIEPVFLEYTDKEAALEDMKRAGRKLGLTPIKQR